MCSGDDTRERDPEVLGIKRATWNQRCIVVESLKPAGVMLVSRKRKHEQTSRIPTCSLVHEHLRITNPLDQICPTRKLRTKTFSMQNMQSTAAHTAVPRPSACGKVRSDGCTHGLSGVGTPECVCVCVCVLPLSCSRAGGSANRTADRTMPLDRAVATPLWGCCTCTAQ